MFNDSPIHESTPFPPPKIWINIPDLRAPWINLSGPSPKTIIDSQRHNFTPTMTIHLGWEWGSPSHFRGRPPLTHTMLHGTVSLRETKSHSKYLSLTHTYLSNIVLTTFYVVVCLLVFIDSNNSPFLKLYETHFGWF